MTDSSGNIIESYTYDPYGAATVLNAAGTVISQSAYGNRFLFTGREYLEEIDLYDYRNRVYSAELGRFVQTDPIRFDAGDVNIYRYAFNNPLRWIDPFGLLSPNMSFNPSFGSTMSFGTGSEVGGTGVGYSDLGASAVANSLTPQQWSGIGFGLSMIVGQKAGSALGGWAGSVIPGVGTGFGSATGSLLGAAAGGWLWYQWDPFEVYEPGGE